MKTAAVTERGWPPVNGKRALAIAAITCCIMFAFETAKMARSPKISAWASHTITALFVSVMCAIVSLVVLRRDKSLRLKMASTEERYKLLFERSLTGAYRTTMDGRVLDCNLAFCRIFGYASREEVIGHSVDIECVEAADRVEFIEKLSAETNVINFEQRLKTKDGRIVWVLNSATLLTPDRGTGTLIRGTLTDITDLRNAEQENRRLAAIVRGSDDAIISKSLDGTIETWNEGAERIYGYRAEETIGRSVALLARADRADEFSKILEQIRNGCGLKYFETICLGKSGEEIAVHLTVSPVKDANGVIVGASTIARDITDRKRADDMLRKSEVQYRLLFNSSPIPMWVFDRRTLRFLQVNEAAVQKYGFSEDEFLAMTLTDIRPQEDISERLEHLEVGAKGLPAPEVWRHRKKNGEVFDVEIVGHDLDFQGTDAMLVAVHDITERNGARQLLEDSENQYRVLFEDSADAYWLMDEKVLSTAIRRRSICSDSRTSQSSNIRPTSLLPISPTVRLRILQPKRRSPRHFSMARKTLSGCIGARTAMFSRLKYV